MTAAERARRLEGERIIRMRKEIPEIGWGEFEAMATRDVAVLALCYKWRNNAVLFLHNLASTPREVTFTVPVPPADAAVLINLLSEDHSQADDAGRHRLLLEAYGYRWFRVGGLDYLLRRSDVDTEAPTQR